MAERNPKESAAAVRSFAYKVLRRIHRLGAASCTLEDVEQELWIAWCIAAERYDPNCGAQFSTYLFNGMRMHINRWIEVQFERFHDQTLALSLDAHVGGEEDEGAAFSDVVRDEQASRGFEEVENEDCYNHALSRLSPRAQMFLQLLKDQPRELVDGVRHLDAKAQFAKERGVPFYCQKRVTISMIMDFMGASRMERSKIMEEVERVAGKIQKQVSL